MAQNSLYYREDTANISVDVTGVFTGAQFSVFDGGHQEAATEIVHPGNMEDGVAIGGIVTPADVTLEVPYGDGTAPWVPTLYSLVGKATVKATVTPRDGDGNVKEGAITRIGILKTVTLPKRDSATSAKAMLQIVFTPNVKLGQ